jgi:hypothetical protein
MKPMAMQYAKIAIFGLFIVSPPKMDNSATRDLWQGRFRDFRLASLSLEPPVRCIQSGDLRGEQGQSSVGASVLDARR